MRMGWEFIGNEYDRKVRVSEETIIVPLPKPRRAFRVHHNPTETWVEEGEVVALMHQARCYTWDGLIKVERHTKQGWWTHTADGGEIEVDESPRHIDYLFLGFEGEADTTPLDFEAIELYWDKASAEEAARAHKTAEVAQ